MKKKALLCVISCMLLAGCNVYSDSQNLTESAGKAVACYGEAVSKEPLYQFCYSFFKGNMSSENPFMSPLSAYYAVSLAASGADGKTREELQEVLGDDFYQICDEMMNILPREDVEEHITISLANSAWLDDNFRADKDWLLEINTYFESDVFKSNLSSEATMEDINLWCSEKTYGLIPQFLTAPLSADTRLALFNALYFKGQWRDQFGKGATRQEAFYLEDGSLTSVEMMHNYNDYQFYFEDVCLQGVCLPYYDGTTFVALMPTDDSTIRELYDSLSVEELIAYAKTDNTTFLNLQLPKFRAESSLDLVDYFKSQGVDAAFSAEKADFHRMGTTNSGAPIYISDIIQQAVIEVNEDGTEAGAVTMVAAEEGAAEPSDTPIDVFFNRPFFYMLYDKKADTPLFMGIFEKP